MAKFRKKPVVIEAEQYEKKSLHSPPAGVCFCPGSPASGQMSLGKPHVHTLEGLMYVSDGDWIITGVKGERYPCKPGIFKETYDREPDGGASR